MRHLKTVLATLGAVTVLVLAGNTIALAATGQSFLLGKSNSANTYTGLTRTTSGSVLSLKSASSSNAPLAVNGKGRVANLNADTVDGVDSSTMKTTTYVYKSPVTTPTDTVIIDIPVPDGTYLFTYAAYLNGSQGLAVDCYLARNGSNGSFITGESRFVASASYPGGLTGAGVITKDAQTTSLQFVCYTPTGTWTTFSNEPIQITATRIDTVLGTTTLPRRLTPRVVAH